MKGGCVNSLLEICTKCGQGGSKNLMRRWYVRAPFAKITVFVRISKYVSSVFLNALYKQDAIPAVRDTISPKRPLASSVAWYNSHRNSSVQSNPLNGSMDNSLIKLKARVLGSPILRCWISGIFWLMVWICWFHKYLDQSAEPYSTP